MRYALTLLIALTALFSASLTGCKDKGNDAGGGDADEIRVGVFLSLSGANADFGKTTKNGIDLAVEEINEAGGINGKKLVIIAKDTRSKPEEAQTVAKQLASQDKVAVAIGSVESGQSIKAAPVFQEAGIPMVSPSSTNPDVTKQGDRIFRVCYLDDFQGQACAAFAYKDLNLRKAALIYAQDDDYSKGLAQYFREAFKGMGGSIVEEAPFQGDVSEFKDQVSKIAAAGPDVIFAPVYYAKIGLIARDFRKQGVTVPLLGGDGWESPQLIQLAGETLEEATSDTITTLTTRMRRCRGI
ncbi:MAG: ABC transporter substrate-binding protein [Planctomycetota bacterium]|nr:ABC transporter substrate-binding protein [Planctomycetota bacterium]